MDTSQSNEDEPGAESDRGTGLIAEHTEGPAPGSVKAVAEPAETEVTLIAFYIEMPAKGNACKRQCLQKAMPAKGGHAWTRQCLDKAFLFVIV